MFVNLDKVTKITAEQKSGGKSKYYLVFEFENGQKEFKYADTVEDLETWITNNLPINFVSL